MRSQYMRVAYQIPFNPTVRVSLDQAEARTQEESNPNRKAEVSLRNEGGSLVRLERCRV